jgi:hypothetical protein
MENISEKSTDAHHYPDRQQGKKKLKGEFLPGNRGRYIIISFSQDYQKQNSPAYPDP